MYNFNIDFEFDPGKSRRNYEKHGISFEEAKEIWTVLGVTLEAREGEEPRFIRISYWRERFYTCIFTVRNERIRMISVRRSRLQEEKFYRENLKNEKENQKDDHS